MKHIVSRMSSYFPNRWPLSYLNLTKNMKTYIRRQQHKKFKHQDIKQKEPLFCASHKYIFHAALPPLPNQVRKQVNIVKFSMVLNTSMSKKVTYKTQKKGDDERPEISSNRRFLGSPHGTAPAAVIANKNNC